MERIQLVIPLILAKLEINTDAKQVNLTSCLLYVLVIRITDEDQTLCLQLLLIESDKNKISIDPRRNLWIFNLIIQFQKQNGKVSRIVQ
jgi:hypothetical protein